MHDRQPILLADMTRRFRIAGWSAVSVLLLPVLINVATNALPKSWLAYEWVAAPLALLLAAVLIARQGRGSADGDLVLAKVADELATAVRRQWDAEAAIRQLNDPYPLPVCWHAADSELFEPWEKIRATAIRWLGQRRPPPGTGWAADPPGLAGCDDDLADVLGRRVPTRRLVVLGDPGAGKTMLLVRLVRSQLARRAAAGNAAASTPVPVLFSLASWDPSRQGLRDWLVDQLITDYPGLRDPAPSVGRESLSRARALLDDGFIFPVLDGFDEIPGELWASALDMINEAMRNHGLVLSSRVEQFRQAVNPEGKPFMRLRGAAGIELEALDTAAVRNYLSDSTIDDPARWDPVLELLDTDAPVADALRNPLRLSLARAIYNPRPGEQAENVPAPAELCDHAKFDEPQKVDDHLFRAFVPAAYRRYPGQHHPPSCTASQAEVRLAFLARHIRERRDGMAGLAWWQLREATPPPLIGVVAGLLPGVAVGLAAGLTKGLGVGLGLGIFAAVTVALAPVPRLRASRPRSKANPSVPRLAGLLPDGRLTYRHGGIVRGIAGGLAGGALGGLVGGLTLVAVGLGMAPVGGIMGGLGAGIGAGAIGGARRGLLGGFVGGAVSGLTAGLGPGVAAGLVDGTAAWLAAGLTVALAGARVPAREMRALHWSPVGLVVGVTVGAAIGAKVWLDAGPGPGLAAGIITGALGGLAAGLEGAPVDLEKAVGPQAILARDRGTFWLVAILGALSFGLGAWVGVRPSVGLAAGLTVGLVAACVQASWGAFAITRSWLAMRRQITWPLMGFLDDAHRRGVLRQAGAIYQFRHTEMQQHLANRNDLLDRRREPPAMISPSTPSQPGARG
jgi:GTPase SAR1 family protein